MLEDELKEAAGDITYGLPDDQAAKRIIKSMSALVLSRARGSGRTVHGSVTALLLGGSYRESYITTMSKAYSFWDTELSWAVRDLWVDRMLSDVRAVRKSLEGSPVSFALGPIDTAIAAVESAFLEGRSLREGSPRSRPLEDEEVMVPEGPKWDGFQGLSKYLSSLKLKPTTSFAPAFRADPEDHTMLYPYLDVNRLPTNDIMWIALQLLEGTGQVVFEKSKTNNSTCLRLRTSASQAELTKDTAVQCYRALRYTIRLSMAKRFVLAWEDTLNHLLEEDVISTASPISHFSGSAYGDTGGWVFDEAHLAMTQVTTPTHRIDEALEELARMEGVLREGAKRVRSVHEEMRRTIEEHPDLANLVDCQGVSGVMPALLKYVFLDTARLPELLLLLQAAAGRQERVEATEITDEEEEKSNALSLYSKDILKVLLRIMPMAGDPVFRKRIMAEAVRGAKSSKS